MADGRVPAGAGEMAARIRAHDWASTPLGPMASWPASLGATVGLMLGTRHPASIAWGADLVLLCNDAFARRLGAARHLAFLGRPAREVPLLVEAELRQVLERGEPTWHEGRPVPVRQDGRMEEVHWTYSHGPIHEPTAPNGVGGVLTLVAETTGANLARRESEARYRSLLGALDEGFCALEMIFDEASRPVDYRFLETNAVFEQQTGLRDVVGRRVRELVPEIEPFWPETYGRVALTGEPIRFVDRSGAMGRWFDVYACRVGPARDRHVAVLFRDITARVQSEAALRELERRQGFLLRLNDALRPLRDTGEIEAEACRLLGQHLGVAQVGFGGVDHDRLHVTVQRDWNDGRLASVAGTWRMRDFGPSLIADMRRGLTAAIPDIALDPRTNAPEVQRAYAGIGTRAILDVPLLREGRQVAMLFIHHPEPRAWTPAEVALVEEVAGRLWTLMERARTEAALRDSEAWLRLAQEAAEMGVYERDLARRRARWSPPLFRIWGLDPEGRDPWIAEAEYDAFVLPEDLAALRAARAAQEVDPLVGRFAFEYRIRRADTGEVRWIASRGEYVRDAAGRAVLARGTVHDMTERKAAEERQALLAREVDHRAKNALAVVQSVVQMTQVREPEAFKRAVQGRISALARAQTLLAEDRWTGADLRVLLEGELAPFRDERQRVTLDGPRVILPPGAAQPIAMAAHELATNAVKYGALSVPGGAVTVRWRLEGGTPGNLRLLWTERGGPAVEGAPSRRGFGTRVLDGTVRGQLGGSMSLTWELGGLVCEMTVPLRGEPGKDLD